MSKANISKPIFCPYCSTEIPQDKIKGRLDRCPECFSIIVKPENARFTNPNYITAQKEKLVESLSTEIKRGSLLTPDAEDIRNIIIAEEDRWYRDSLHYERLYAMTDACGILRHLPYTKSSPEQIRHIITLGKKIGDMADAIDKLYKSGVAGYDREIRPTRPNSGEAELD